MKKIGKRIIDLMIAVIALIVLAPLFLSISIILKFTGEGEIFYLQKRLGYLNKEFNIIKFATMIKNSSKIGTRGITIKNDPRVLPVGKFLRKSKINELPQIFNVFLGNMSIVGPRPQMKSIFEQFPIEKRDKIFKSKPGITGVGSIIFRDEEKWISNYNGDKHEFYREKIAPYKADVEIWYYRNHSLFLDLKIVILTAWVIIFPKSNLTFKVLKTLPKKPFHLS